VWQGPYFEALLVVLVLFQEYGIIDDDLCVCDAKLEDLVIHRFCGLDGPYRLFEVDIKGPQLE
jgi:hypothetical protein